MVQDYGTVAKLIEHVKKLDLSMLFMENEVNTAKLKEAASRATPGPWGLSKGGEVRCVGNYDNPGEVCVSKNLDNARYIVAASPDVVLSLIAENERLKGAIRDIQKHAINVFCAGTEFREAAYGIANDSLDKEVKIKQLEKEADWLAMILSDLCAGGECPIACVGGNCSFDDKCNISGSKIKDWREAAHKAILD